MIDTSFAYLAQSFGWILGSVMFSRDCIIASARNPGIGEPVSVILIYLFTLPLNLKHLYMRNALKKRLNFNVRGDSTKEYFAELEHAVK